METAPLLLDGGTEGLRGQMRLCIPGVTACYECGIGTLAPQASLAQCGISLESLLWPMRKGRNVRFMKRSQLLLQ